FISAPPDKMREQAHLRYCIIRSARDAHFVWRRVTGWKPMTLKRQSRSKALALVGRGSGSAPWLYGHHRGCSAKAVVSFNARPGVITKKRIRALAAILYG